MVVYIWQHAELRIEYIYKFEGIKSWGHKEVFGGIMEDFRADPFEWIFVDVFSLVLLLLDIAS